MNKMDLKQFTEVDFDYSYIEKVLTGQGIKTIKIFSLGPEGTNIIKATRQWVEKTGISHKSEYIYCDTPEEEVEKAREVKESGVFPIIALCAVYYKLNDLYFNYEDCYFFMHHYYMPLDKLQLAAREEVETIPEDWTIAVHPSPKPLITGLKNKTVKANSNSSAAQLCAAGIANACITTEEAKTAYSLKTLHSFGAPNMLFTFGTTKHGINLLKQLSPEREG